jgi:hypothetical protein
LRNGIATIVMENKEIPNPVDTFTHSMIVTLEHCFVESLARKVVDQFDQCMLNKEDSC